MYDVRFVLKADDDAFINVPALVRELKAHCQTPGCRKERMYFGKEIRNNVVRLAAGDRWQVCLESKRRRPKALIPLSVKTSSCKKFEISPCYHTSNRFLIHSIATQLSGVLKFLISGLLHQACIAQVMEGWRSFDV